MRALGRNVIIREDAAETQYSLDQNTNLIKPDVFQTKSRYATVVSVGCLVSEDLKESDRVYLRSMATIGSEITVDGITYGVVDEAEILLVLGD